MIKRKSNNLGYTLIELLTVVWILTVIGGVMAGILYSTLRGSSKVRITTEVAQSGDYALSVIKGIVADARNITEVNGAAVQDCTSSPTSPAGAATCTSGSDYCSIKLRKIDGGDTTISCEQVGGVFTIASNGASLINRRTVKASSCSFSCTQLIDQNGLPDPYSVPVVNVSFTISDLSTGFFESKSSSPFNASISLRSYSP